MDRKDLNSYMVDIKSSADFFKESIDILERAEENLKNSDVYLKKKRKMNYEIDETEKIRENLVGKKLECGNLVNEIKESRTVIEKKLTKRYASLRNELNSIFSNSMNILSKVSERELSELKIFKKQLDTKLSNFDFVKDGISTEVGKIENMNMNFSSIKHKVRSLTSLTTTSVPESRFFESTKNLPLHKTIVRSSSSSISEERKKRESFSPRNKIELGKNDFGIGFDREYNISSVPSSLIDDEVDEKPWVYQIVVEYMNIKTEKKTRTYGSAFLVCDGLNREFFVTTSSLFTSDKRFKLQKILVFNNYSNGIELGESSIRKSRNYGTSVIFLHPPVRRNEGFSLINTEDDPKKKFCKVMGCVDGEVVSRACKIRKYKSKKFSDNYTCKFYRCDVVTSQDFIGSVVCSNRKIVGMIVKRSNFRALAISGEILFEQFIKCF